MAKGGGIMDARFKYSSLAAGYIAHEMGFIDDSERVKKLFTAIFEAVVRAEPTKCPAGYAEGSVVPQITKPKPKMKRDS